MARIICTGLGPGDPELMAVRADRLIRAASQIAYFRKAGRAGQARQIVEGMLAATVVEHAMEYPVTTELPFDSPDYNVALAGFYDAWAARLVALLDHIPGKTVLLWLGDHAPLPAGGRVNLHADPLLIDAEMIATVRAHASDYLEVLISPAARAHGLAGMAFAPLEQPAALEVPGPTVHAEVAARLAVVLRRLI